MGVGKEFDSVGVKGRAGSRAKWRGRNCGGGNRVGRGKHGEEYQVSSKWLSVMQGIAEWSSGWGFWRAEIGEQKLNES